MIITIMKRSFTTMKYFTTMKSTMKNLFIMNLTITGLTMRRNITMGMSCMTHHTIHWYHRKISSVSNMRSTESQQHAEALTPIMNLTMTSLIIKYLTIGGGFQHPEDLSQGIGAVRAT